MTTDEAELFLNLLRGLQKQMSTAISSQSELGMGWGLCELRNRIDEAIRTVEVKYATEEKNDD